MGVTGDNDPLAAGMDSLLRSARVFLIEDSSDDEYLIRRAVERLFPEIALTVAHDGHEALTICRDLTVLPPHLILLDIKLPKLNGIEVLKELRRDSRFAHVPVVILTMSTQREDIDAAYANGANGYVSKPQHFDEYVERFAIVLHYWLDINLS